MHNDFGIKDKLVFATGHGGLTMGTINTDVCTASFYLHGAHVTNWQPAGHEPVLYLSTRSNYAPGKAIRGGIPIIWPWFGAKTIGDPKGSPPAHGFARNRPWDIIATSISDGGAVRVTLTLPPQHESSDKPCLDEFNDLRAVCEMEFGETLRMALQVTNTGAEAITYEQAFHSYFAVSDISKTQVQGLKGIDYLDKVDSFKQKTQKDDVVTFNSEVDRPYLDCSGAVTIDDKASQRKIIINRDHSNSVIVWNPGLETAAKLSDLDADGWQHFVCVEAGNVAKNAVTLPPGNTHTMSMAVSVIKYAI